MWEGYTDLLKDLIDNGNRLITSSGIVCGRNSSQQYESHKKVFKHLVSLFEKARNESIAIDSFMREQPPILKAKIYLKNRSTKRELEIISEPVGLHFSVSTSGLGKRFRGTAKNYTFIFSYKLPAKFIDNLIKYLDSGDLNIIKELKPKKIKSSK